MRFVSILICVLLTTKGITQQSVVFLDHNKKPILNVGQASYLQETEKTDSGWLKRSYLINAKSLIESALFADSFCLIRKGYFHAYHPNGLLKTIGHYSNGKKTGLWLQYHSNGMLADSAWYDNDLISGVQKGWHRNGFMSDSSNGEMGKRVSLSWFDDGTPEAAGRYVEDSLRHGKWVFYNQQGEKCATVIYDRGKAATVDFIQSDGSIQAYPYADSFRVAADFPGGVNGWLKYFNSKIYFPDNVQLVNTSSVTIMVQFCVSPAGEVKDVELLIPFHPAFDKIVLDIVRKSPRWNPARIANRPYPYYHTQQITFNQSD
jgi:antitoxin component YwqK of YwqJK toxin-antitoxin module